MSTSEVSGKERGVCEVCMLAVSKYTCPRCAKVTCSLACSKEHKAKDGCSGERIRNNYIPRSQFSEASLHSDVGFLQDLARGTSEATEKVGHVLKRTTGGKRAPSAGKKRKVVRPDGSADTSSPTSLQEALDARGTTLSRMPPGLSKARANRTVWFTPANGDPPFISWTIEWRLYDAEGRLTKTSTMNRMDERCTVNELIKKNLTSLGLDEASTLPPIILLQRPHVPANAHIYHILPSDQPLLDSLAHKTVLEFPTLHLYYALPAHVVVDKGVTEEQGFVQDGEDSSSSSEEESDSGSSSEEASSNDDDDEEDEEDSSKSLPPATEVSPIEIPPTADTDGEQTTKVSHTT